MTTQPLETTVSPPRPPRRSPRFTLSRAGLWIFVGLACFLSLVPFYLMFVWASLPSSQIFTVPPHLWFGDALTSNFQKMMAATDNHALRQFWNSLYIAILSTVTTLFFCSLAGFAFAMYEFKGKRYLFGFILITMLIPPLVMDIPSFLVMNNFLHWIGTPRTLWVPGMANAFGIFLMRQYIFSALPKSLIEAARLDGATEFGIYTRVVLPLIRPILATLGIVTFVGSWNNFKGALIMRLSEDSTMTLPLSLRKITGGATNINADWGATLMMVVLTVLPLLIIFLLASRQVISGLTSGAVKD
ncbi:carbohydrate ABC transporter permease [Deinococcus humi]|uniref:Multiple sugar transport system permease protein n=1 Tax=Deinococcus humi TaxID=662880 RepID=A0A7W8JSS1_9DEIO|nr:carbohydrate ABC transporter permease [Deinococcus humi]MBB5362585.1 multiple sugar transport system permease protein [Deinococcus humi]GGO31490.1 sugar ABC transporter ATP-binding protein [Deinococcus humi]